MIGQLSTAILVITLWAGQLNAGAVYTRWGNRACPSTSNLVYTGVTGGAYATHSGGATNALCLPLNPVYTTDAHAIDTRVAGFASLYGSEYEVSPEPAHNRDGVCAVCMSSRPETIMVPVTYVCPSGWIKEYSGYIMAARPDDGRSGTQFICVDSTLDGLLGSERSNSGGMLLYYTKTRCGSLPCPPFKEGQVVSCVVCSH